MKRRILNAMRSIAVSVRWLERILLVAAVVLAVTLASQKATLQEGAGRALRQSTQPHVGMYVPEFSTTTLDGTPVRIGSPPSERSQVLYFFLTSCEYCQTSAPMVRTLAMKLQPGSTGVAAAAVPEFVAVALDSVPPPEALLAEQGVPGPVVHLTSRRIMTLFRTGSVPRLDILGSDGRIAYTRTGVILTDAVVDSVLAAARAAARAQGQVAGAF